MLLCSLPLCFPSFVGDLDLRDRLDAWIGLDLLSLIPGMGVELELLRWEPLFLMLLSFRSLMRPTSSSSKSNPGETLFDMSSLPRVLGKTGQSHSLRLLA